MSYCITPEFMTVRRVQRSRRLHRCCETGKVIPAGAPAVLISGKWDGDVRTYRMRPEVWSLWGKVDSQLRQVRDWDDCLEFGGLRDHFAEVRRFEPASPLLAEWDRILAIA